jgi:hypothetical protein
MRFSRFRFSRSRGEDDFDSRETGRSGKYFLGGVIETLADVEARNSPNETILRSNMRNNGIARVIRSEPDRNCWRWTLEFTDADTRLDWDYEPVSARRERAP